MRLVAIVWRGVLLAALALATACGPQRGRVIVLGLDGLDPAVVEKLASAGRLPNIASLQRSGSTGTLRAAPPLLSPILWTTIATGRPPEAHGIGGFAPSVQEEGEETPVTSTMRRVPAVWNIASNRGLGVGVVGWWATWPPERLCGTVVSDRTCYHFLLADGHPSGDDLSTVVSPPEASGWVAPLVRRPDDVTGAELSRVARVTPDVATGRFTFSDDVQHLRWALATADSYSRIGLELWRREQPRLLMVYIEAPDTVSHLFGHLYEAPPLTGEMAVQQARFGDTVAAVYELLDAVVGRFVAAMDRDTTLLVLSDHGFHLGQLGPRESVPGGDPRRVSARHHAPEGVLMMSGRGIRPGSRTRAARQLDVAPTVLTLLGLPAAGDMPGRVLSEALTGIEVPDRVATYGRAEPAADRAASAGNEADQELLHHLHSLGYLGGGGSRPADKGHADMLLRAGRPVEAAEEYRALLKQRPGDPELLLNLGVAEAAQGSPETAESCFEQALDADPTSARALLNLGLIAERRGDTELAIARIRRAAQYDPGLDGARRALVRLTGSELPFVLTSEAEREAAALATAAAAAQTRGDLPLAADLTERATRTAPELAPIWEQRAMVAYLRGRLAEAERDLERCVELDPGNAMARKNLDVVRRRRAEARDGQPPRR